VHDLARSHSQLHRWREDDEHARAQLEDWDQSASHDDDDGGGSVNGGVRDGQSWSRRRRLKAELEVALVLAQIWRWKGVLVE